mmetsp:Transcript_84290/g.238861  ORF Transcript_84290/g.238861 Transcript_84290/m.238861 type:complete len:213 (-) Transcript_84290:52-690(-)
MYEVKWLLAGPARVTQARPANARHGRRAGWGGARDVEVGPRAFRARPLRDGARRRALHTQQPASHVRAQPLGALASRDDSRVQRQGQLPLRGRHEEHDMPRLRADPRRRRRSSEACGRQGLARPEQGNDPLRQAGGLPGPRAERPTVREGSPVARYRARRAARELAPGRALFSNCFKGLAPAMSSAPLESTLLRGVLFGPRSAGPTAVAGHG